MEHPAEYITMFLYPYRRQKKIKLFSNKILRSLASLARGVLHMAPGWVGGPWGFLSTQDGHSGLNKVSCMSSIEFPPLRYGMCMGHRIPSSDIQHVCQVSIFHPMTYNMCVRHRNFFEWHATCKCGIEFLPATCKMSGIEFSSTDIQHIMSGIKSVSTDIQNVCHACISNNNSLLFAYVRYFCMFLFNSRKSLGGP